METRFPLQVKKLSPNAFLPSKGSDRAAGYDLCSIEETVVPARGKALVKTGLAIAVPSGNYGRVAPRSGLAVKKFIDVGAGVIDEDYRGEVGVVLFNHSEEDFKVSPGDRIAQLIIEKISATEIVEVDELNDTARGAGGFGSTGISVENIKNIKPAHQVDDVSNKRSTPYGGFLNKEVLYLDGINIEDDVEWKEWSILVLCSLPESGAISLEEKKQWERLVFADKRRVYDALKEYIQHQDVAKLKQAYQDIKNSA